MQAVEFKKRIKSQGQLLTYYFSLLNYTQQTRQGFSICVLLQIVSKVEERRCPGLYSTGVRRNNS